MPDLFNPEEQTMLEAYAQRRGFPSLRSYLWTLIRQEMDQDGDSTDDSVEPPESHKRVWEDAMNRRPMSWEEFLRHLGD